MPLVGTGRPTNLSCSNALDSPQHKIFNQQSLHLRHQHSVQVNPHVHLASDEVIHPYPVVKERCLGTPSSGILKIPWSGRLPTPQWPWGRECSRRSRPVKTTIKNPSSSRPKAAIVLCLNAGQLHGRGSIVFRSVSLSPALRRTIPQALMHQSGAVTRGHDRV